jgi:thiamine-monophosphate kinase
VLSKEDLFINHFPSLHIGDDGAVVGNTVYSKDVFVEDVHFKKEWLSVKQIAQKAMLVNISDAIVMNAKPKYALIGIGFPKSFSKKDLKDLSDGFKAVAEKYGIEIIGGDTVSSDKIFISITLVSKTKRPIFRSGAKVGDLVAYTGSLGDVQKDFDALLSKKKIKKSSKFIKPVLKDAFFYKAAPFINSAIDISDGLFKELSRLSKQSSVGFEFFEEIKKSVGCSGEEYEILFTFSKEDLEKVNKIAKNKKTDINIIAKVTKGRFNSPCKEHHF